MYMSFDFQRVYVSRFLKEKSVEYEFKSFLLLFLLSFLSFSFHGSVSIPLG